MAKRGNKADSDERRDARLTEELPDSDPWGGLFENLDDWIGGYLAGDPPLRLAENWIDTNWWLAEAVSYDAAYELIDEGRRWEDCSVEVRAASMAKHLRRRLGEMLHTALLAHIDAIRKAGEEVIATAEADLLAAGYTQETAPLGLFEERQEHHARRKREEWARERAERGG
ncbi:MAG: hypothetical protein M3Q71_23625 [Chloroflexota bacterium]|nr:hypothetical protein [Chloroflexota bacterium]